MMVALLDDRKISALVFFTIVDYFYDYIFSLTDYFTVRRYMHLSNIIIVKDNKTR